MNHIPPMTDPLGRYWNQPSVDQITLDDTHALMDGRAFNGLANYSASLPSGVYPGKMWKAVFNDGTAQLRWYGIVEGRPDICSNNCREILVAEASQ